MLETYKNFRKMTYHNDKLYELTDQDVKDIQKALLDIMKDIDAFCRKYHITYFTCGGTCLGAVRHKGFIPWDDDMDICMPRKDYERFIRGFAKVYRKKYWVQNVKRDSVYDLNFSKVRKKGTKFEEIFDMDREKAGLFIDIYPLENAFDNPVLRRLHGTVIDGLLLICSCVRVHSKWKKLKAYTEGNQEMQKSLRMKNILGTILGIVPLHGWLLLTEHISDLCKNEHSRYVMIPSGRKHTFGEMCDRVHYFPPKDTPFEDMMIQTQNHPVEHLNRLYKDYRVIPPVEDRVRHSVVFYQLRSDEHGQD